MSFGAGGKIIWHWCIKGLGGNDGKKRYRRKTRVRYVASREFPSVARESRAQAHTTMKRALPLHRNSASSVHNAPLETFLKMLGRRVCTLCTHESRSRS